MTDTPTGRSPFIRRYYELREFLGLALDEHRLNELFEQIIQYYADAGKLAADADAEETARRHTYDIIKAAASQRIRMTPIAGKEPSEARIAALLPLEKDVQEARAALDNAKYEAQVCDGLYRSYDQQSRLLGKASDRASSRYGAPEAAYDRSRAELREARIANAERQSSGGPIGRPTD